MNYSTFTTWRTRAFLAITLMTTLCLLLLDPLMKVAGETVALSVFIFILAGCALSVLLAFIVFRSRAEKKGLASLALLFTVLNVGVVLFSIWLGIQAF